MKTAMKAQDKERLATIRLILSAFKQKEVDERVVLSDEQVLAILDKMVKQRRESIKEFEKASRQDLIDKEVFEVNIIQTYLPQQLSQTEIDSIVDACIKESGATSAKDMGKVMGLLKPKVQGRADVAAVSNQVKQKLGA